MEHTSVFRVVVSAALICLSMGGTSPKQQLVKEIIPGIGSFNYHATAMNWTDAAAFCRGMGSHEVLAYPHTADEAKLMSSLMTANKHTNIHAGFHDKYEEGVYYTSRGTRVSQSCYQTWYKQNGGTNFNCGGFKVNAGIFDESCIMQSPFICANYNIFRADYDFIPGHGYYKMHRGRLGWLDAQQMCETEGAFLLVLNSEAELTALYDKYGPDFYVWVGLHHIHKNMEFVSIFEESLSSTGFSRWDAGEPKGNNTVLPYVAVRKTTNITNYGLQLRYATEFYPFICEIRT